MEEISQIIGTFVIIYISAIGIVMVFTNSSVEEARKIISSFLKSNGYDLAKDSNYKLEINQCVKDILGEARYGELCDLAKYCSTLQFCDNHAGLPSIKVTLNYEDDNEERCLESVLENLTKKYLLNYGNKKYTKVLIDWSKNEILHIPMLTIIYSRNEKEFQVLSEFEKIEIKKISAKYMDIVDEEDGLI